MATLLALAGSPRKQGNTRTLLQELIKGAESRGGMVKVYDLNDPAFRGCQSCFTCRTRPRCSVQDVFTPFYEEIDAAAGVVFASPIYFADITGQAKMGLDRLFPMLDGASFSPRFPGKKVAAIYSQGDSDPARFASAIAAVRGFFHTFGWKQEHCLICAGAGDPGYAIPEELLKEAFDAGAALAG